MCRFAHSWYAWCITYAIVQYNMMQFYALTLSIMCIIMLYAYTINALVWLLALAGLISNVHLQITQKLEIQIHGTLNSKHVTITRHHEKTPKHWMPRLKWNKPNKHRENFEKHMANYKIVHMHACIHKHKCKERCIDVRCICTWCIQFT